MLLLEVLTYQYPIWENVFFYVFVGTILIFFMILVVLTGFMKKKSADMMLLQQQHVARINVIRKEHIDKLESLRIEMLKREEERIRQWIESEKETLHVLNGVSNLLELGGRVDNVEFKKINKVLNIIEVTINKLIQNNGKN